MFWEEKKRKPIPMSVKRRVYSRAEKMCEKCGRPLKMRYGDFHHTRDPTVTPRASSVRFLCPICHRKYGHKRKTRKTETLFGVEKKVKIVRQDVVKVKKPAKKKSKTKRVAIRGLFGEITGYKTVKVRKTKTGKKKTATKKRSRKTTSKSKKTSRKKKTTTRRTTRKTKKKKSS